jgi:hybrid cluster-associated redox disulfide protein
MTLDKKMSIEQVVRKYPETVAIFERRGLGCAGCKAALFESIEQGAEVHGIDVETLMADLNREVARARTDSGEGMQPA